MTWFQGWYARWEFEWSGEYEQVAPVEPDPTVARVIRPEPLVADGSSYADVVVMLSQSTVYAGAGSCDVSAPVVRGARHLPASFTGDVATDADVADGAHCADVCGTACSADEEQTTTVDGSASALVFVTEEAT